MTSEPGSQVIGSTLSRRRMLSSLARLGGLALLAGYPVFIERTWLRVTTLRFPIPNLPASFRGYRIVHLTDIHHGFLVSLDFVRSVVEKANALEGDVIVCTGDYVQKRRCHNGLDRVWPVLSELTAPDGVYAVLGNHDHWADTERSLYWLNRSGQGLRRKVHRLGRGSDGLWLVGAGDLWEDHLPLDHLLGHLPTDECRIVLAHNPDTADTRYTERVDAFIAGHTHGGQVCIPGLGSPFAPIRNATYAWGLRRSPRGVPVFISRGIGWSVVPLRINCPPEIVVLELAPADQDDSSDRAREAAG